MKKIAVARLHLPDGRILLRQVITFTDNGTPVSYSPLTEETPFTEWHNIDYHWK